MSTYTRRIVFIQKAAVNLSVNDDSCFFLVMGAYVPDWSHELHTANLFFA